jgi:hypothetical protein
VKQRVFYHPKLKNQSQLTFSSRAGITLQLVDTFTSSEAARALASLLMQRNLRIAGEKEQHQQTGEGPLSEMHETANLDEKTRVVQERLTG